MSSQFTRLGSCATLFREEFDIPEAKSKEDCRLICRLQSALIGSEYYLAELLGDKAEGDEFVLFLRQVIDDAEKSLPTGKQVAERIVS